MYDEVLHKYDEEVYFRLRAALSNHSAMQSHYFATHSLLPRQPNRRTTHSLTYESESSDLQLPIVLRRPAASGARPFLAARIADTCTSRREE